MSLRKLGCVYFLRERCAEEVLKLIGRTPFVLVTSDAQAITCCLFRERFPRRYLYSTMILGLIAVAAATVFMCSVAPAFSGVCICMCSSAIRLTVCMHLYLLRRDSPHSLYTFLRAPVRFAPQFVCIFTCSGAIRPTACFRFYVLRRTQGAGCMHFQNVCALCGYLSRSCVVPWHLFTFVRVFELFHGT